MTYDDGKDIAAGPVTPGILSDAQSRFLPFPDARPGRCLGLASLLPYEGTMIRRLSPQTCRAILLLAGGIVAVSLAVFRT